MGWTIDEKFRGFSALGGRSVATCRFVEVDGIIVPTGFRQHPSLISALKNTINDATHNRLSDMI